MSRVDKAVVNKGAQWCDIIQVEEAQTVRNKVQKELTSNLAVYKVSNDRIFDTLYIY